MVCAGGTLREAEHAVEGRVLPRRGVPSLVQRMQVEAWCNECRLRVHPCYNHPTHQEPPQHTPTRERTPVERTPVPRRVLVGVQGASICCLLLPQPLPAARCEQLFTPSSWELRKTEVPRGSRGVGWGYTRRASGSPAPTRGAGGRRRSQRRRATRCPPPSAQAARPARREAQWCAGRT